MKILKKTTEKNNSIFKFEYQDKIIFQLIKIFMVQEQQKKYIKNLWF